MVGDITGIVLCGTDKRNCGELKNEKQRYLNSYRENFLIGIYKAMIQFDGRALAQIAVDALSSSQKISRVIAVGPKEKLQGELKGCEIVDSDDGFRGNVARGIQAAESERIVLAACDMPLITSYSIDAFLHECELSGGNVCYPIVHEEAFSPYDGFRERPIFTLRRGHSANNYRLGNLAYMEPEKTRRLMGYFNDIRASRKPRDWASYLNLIALNFRLLGPMLPIYLLAYYTKDLTISRFESISSKAFRTSCRILESHDAAIGIDIDSEEDIEMLRSMGHDVGYMK